MNHQFWGYETGNIVAGVSAAGGFTVFKERLSTGSFFQVCAEYPDVAATLGMGAVVVGAPLLKASLRMVSSKAAAWADPAAALSASTILGFVQTSNTSSLTVSACNFVTGSALLRCSSTNPLFLKLGGLFLASGGIALATFGVKEGYGTYWSSEVFADLLHATTPWGKAEKVSGYFLPALTSVTGAYATVASLLLYEGGIFGTRALATAFPGATSPTAGGFNRLVHPTHSVLANLLKNMVDAPILGINRITKRTLLKFIPSRIRETQPFATSMWARLPWRCLTGVAAMVSGNWSFAAANLGWAYGDFNIGLEELKNKQQQEGPCA